jgi:non-ribosomal peptide synthetase component F
VDGLISGLAENGLRNEVHHGRIVACHADRPADVHAMFMDAARRAPDATALVDGEERWTYGELASRAGRTQSG